MKLSILKKIIISFAFALIILLVIGTTSYYYLLQVKDDVRLQHQTFATDQKLDRLLSLLKDAQRGERGFIITGEEEYLEPFNEALGNVDKVISSIESNYPTNLALSDSLNEIKKLTNEIIAIYRNVINSFRTKGFKSSVDIVKIGDGNNKLTEIAKRVDRLKRNKDQLLQTRLSKINKSLDIVYLTIVFGFIFGLLISMIAIITLRKDLIRRIETESDLKKAKEEAEKLDKLKTEFLAQMSHEIRTPMNSILSSSSFIRDELSDEKSDDLQRLFEIIQTSGYRMTRTIDLILNMAELQTDSYNATYRELDLFDSIIKNIATEYEKPAAEKNINLKIRNDADNPIILGDEYTLTQIFDNLINNAIKYTEKGSIDVTVYRNSGKTIYAKVSDTGIGISDEYLDLIFKPFSQEETGYTRKFEGNGLGLALVKKYCEINNVEIMLKSKKGLGTDITLIFKN